MLALFGALGGVLGAVLVSQGKPFFANLVWTGSNMLMVIYALLSAEYEIMGMFLVYWVIAVYGVFHLYPMVVHEAFGG